MDDGIDLAAMISALPGASALFGVDAPDYTVLAVSDAIVAATGRSRSEIVGRALGEVFPVPVPGGGDRSDDALRASLAAAVRSRTPQRMAQQRYDLPCSDGTWEEHYWDAINTPVLGRDGEVRCILHQTEDVTRRVIDERARARAESRAARLLEQVSDAYVMLDRTFHVVALNSAAERALARPRDALLCRTPWELFPGSETSEIGDAYRRVVAEGVEQHLRNYRAAFGFDRYVDVDAYPTDEGGVAIFWRDVTDRHDAEAENAALAALVRGSGEAMFGLTIDGVIASWNPAAERLFGYTRHEIVGRHMSILAPADRIPEQRDTIARILRGETVSRETVRRAKDGTPLDVLITTGAVFDADGAPASISAVVVDIRERMRAQAALRQREGELAQQYAMLEAIYKDAPVGLAVFDRDLRYLRINERLALMNGLPIAAHLGRTVREVIPDLADDVEMFARQVFETGQPVRDLPLTGQTAAEPGVEHHWVEQWYPLYDAAGEIIGVNVVVDDVTERVRASAALRESETKFRSLFESIDQAFATVEVLYDDAGRATDLRFVETNHVFARATGLHDVVGRTAGEVAPGFELFAVDTYAEVVRTGVPARFETDAHGNGRWYAVSAARVGDDSRCVTVVFDDISPRKRAEAEREQLLTAERVARADAEQARAEAEAANRAKSEFLAVMSHELRTPLNAIGGYAELMEMGIRGPVTSQQREDLRRVQASQRHLLGLINEVLNYAKLETGTVHYAVGDVRLRDALGGAEALVAPQAQAKGIALTVAPYPTELAVRADPEKLRQILVNLLSNAVKFTDAGGRIVLACEPAHDVVRIVVRDTGIGIAVDQLERIFEPFVQVRADFTRPHEGTGLGLAISRDLARAMGGDLGVESAPGHGSAFTLTLPAA